MRAAKVGASVTWWRRFVRVAMLLGSLAVNSVLAAEPAEQLVQPLEVRKLVEDGKIWSQPQPVYQPQFIVWKPCEFGGRFYAGAHKKDEISGGKGREVHLVVSDDGLDWKRISTIRAGNWESETTLHFEPTGHIVALLRQKYSSPACQILESDRPYQQWTPRPAGVPHLSGHCVHTFRGVTYVLSRSRHTLPVGSAPRSPAFSEKPGFFLAESG